MHRRDVHAEPLAQTPRHDQGPGRVHARPERGVQHDPPVAELVTEPLDHDGPVVGHRARRGALVGEVGEQVVGGPAVEPGVAQPGVRRVGIGRGPGSGLAHPGADRRAELGGTAGESPFQNGSRPGSPGAGETRTRSGVISSIRHVLDPSVNVSPTRDS
ncbi:hypothetical protein GCM10025864_41940 [Luteimicrobium album]|uniref:Uncharacterized protein n=1 Tax=Luteimicrobium album TaxID=1054550 RepID=A0ABQ6I7C5_9MICO|nr:hypothetical protein GCM10025864_41940 [Luteimicrobium album]